MLEALQSCNMEIVSHMNGFRLLLPLTRSAIPMKSSAFVVLSPRAEGVQNGVQGGPKRPLVHW
jgi:hypothetical protein